MRAIERRLEEGGIGGLHGTSGGRAERLKGFGSGARSSSTITRSWSDSSTYPPICKIYVDVHDGSALTGVLPAAFDVEDEPDFIELQHPALDPTGLPHAD